MSAIAPPSTSMATYLWEEDPFASDEIYRTDTIFTQPPRRWEPLPRTHSGATYPDVALEDDDWVVRALSLLDALATIPDNWDGEGSPRPAADTLLSAARLLVRMLGSGLGAIPGPFVAPIPRGGIQLEWESSGKYLEIEFLAGGGAAYLKEETTSQGDVTESGEYPHDDLETTRGLLDWFVSF